MAFPASLTLVTVTGRFDTLPSGGTAGTLQFTANFSGLNGPTDNSIVPYVDEKASLDSDGEFSIALPATNDPQWSPSGWNYTVKLSTGTRSRTGTLELDYQTASVDLADLIQWDGTAESGVTYATLAQLTAHADDTTAVHGIADTADLIVEGDARLTDARTPTTHAASHASAGSDPVSLGGSQITSGTVGAARLPDLSATYLATAGGTVTGDLAVQGVLRVTPSSVIEIGADTNLYRSGANLIGTDDALDVSGDLRTFGSLSVSGTASIGGVDFRRADVGSVKATDHNLVGWTYDPAMVQAGTVQPTAGLAQVARVRVLSGVVTNIHFHFTAGGSALTAGQCFAALYNDAGALLGAGAVTADQAASWATGGFKTCALSVAQGVTAYAWYRVLWWFNGTTGPTISRAVNSSSAIVNAGLSSGFRYATADTGLTTAAPGNIGTQTGGATAWWVGLS